MISDLICVLIVCCIVEDNTAILLKGTIEWRVPVTNCNFAFTTQRTVMI